MIERQVSENGDISDRSPARPNAKWMTPLLIVVTLSVMGRLCFNDFTSWDDPGTIHQNPWMNQPLPNALGHYWNHSADGLYIPLTYNAWLVLARLARVTPDQYGIPFNPWVFHTANVVAHTFCAWLVLRLLITLRFPPPAALCGALVYAIHPLQIDAVGWMSGLKDVLSGILGMLATLLYFRSIENQSRLHWWVAILCFVLAMLAKPAIMTLPLIVFALDHWIAQRPAREIWSRLWLWLIAAIPIALIARISQVPAGVPPTPIWFRPFVAADSLAFYLYKLVWPAHLCIDYGRTPTWLMTAGWWKWTWIVPTVIAGLLLVARRSKWTAAAAVFVAGCLPVLGLSTFDFQYFSTTADHYLYVSMLGPAIALALLLQTLPSRLTYALVIAAIAVISWLSFTQGRVWTNDYTLYAQAVAVNPRSFVSWTALGQAYLRDHNDAEAEPLLRRAIVEGPDYFWPTSSLAEVMFRQGRFKDAIVEARQSIEIQQRVPWWSHRHVAEDYERIGLCLEALSDVRSAIEPLSTAVALEPDNSAYADQLRDALRYTTTLPASKP